MIHLTITVTSTFLIGTLLILSPVLYPVPSWAELITGTDGNDDLVGTNGDDQISGLDGNDRISGLAAPIISILVTVITRYTVKMGMTR